MRFDPTGLGDSEGLLDRVEMRDFYGSIQMGMYVEDTLCALEYFCDVENLEKVVLLGLCGGAITCLLTASLSEAVAGLALLSIPVMLDSSKYDYDLRIPSELARLHLKGYARKILVPKYWVRVLTGKSNFTAIRLFVGALFRRDIVSHKTAPKQTNLDANPKRNEKFFAAYERLKGRMPILWIFGSHDSFWFEFKREVVDGGEFDMCDELMLIEGGNHMFTLMEWQSAIIGRLHAWLDKF